MLAFLRACWHRGLLLRGSRHRACFSRSRAAGLQNHQTNKLQHAEGIKALPPPHYAKSVFCNLSRSTFQSVALFSVPYFQPVRTGDLTCLIYLLSGLLSLAIPQLQAGNLSHPGSPQIHYPPASDTWVLGLYVHTLSKFLFSQLI